MIALWAALAIVAPAEKLAWNLSLNDQWTYRLKQRFWPRDGGGADDAQIFSYRGAMRVTGLKADEIDFEVRHSLVEQVHGGMKLPMANAAAPKPQSMIFLRSGVRKYEWERYADEAEFRLSRVLWLVFPTHEQSKEQWEGFIPEVRPDWGRSVVVDYRRIGATTRLNRKCLLYRVHFQETGDEKSRLLMQGKAEIDEMTGVLVYLNLITGIAPLPGAEEPHQLELEYEVDSLKAKAGS